MHAGLHPNISILWLMCFYDAFPVWTMTWLFRSSSLSSTWSGVIVCGVGWLDLRTSSPPFTSGGKATLIVPWRQRWWGFAVLSFSRWDSGYHDLTTCLDASEGNIQMTVCIHLGPFRVVHGKKRSGGKARFPRHPQGQPVSPERSPWFCLVAVHC